MKYNEIRKQEMNEVLENLKKHPRFKNAYINNTVIRVTEQGRTKNICWCTHDGFRIGSAFKSYFDGDTVKEYKDSVTERLIKTNRESLKLVIELTEENNKLRKELDKLEKEFLDALRGL